jgi:Uma2 family endonuclease
MQWRMSSNELGGSVGGSLVRFFSLSGEYRSEMSTAEEPNFVSVDDYLVAEELANSKCDYIDGWVRAMSGGNVRHNRIKVNIVVCLSNQLRGKPCRVYDSDMKIRIRQDLSTKFYYPDASLVCESNGPTESFQDRPVLLVEVLSNSTRAIDLDEKMEAYLTIETIQWYILLEQHKPHAIVMRRTEKGFLRETVAGLDGTIGLSILGMQLPLSEVYADVDFTTTAIHETELSYEIE